MANQTVAGVVAGAPCMPRPSQAHNSAAAPRIAADAGVSLPRLTRGAQAFIALLVEIDEQARATVEPTSDAVTEVQAAYAAQYAAIDAAIAAALDEHGSSEGFRLALAHYLLNIAQGNSPDPRKMNAGAVLADNGYRAMPTSDEVASADGIDFENEGFRLSRMLALANWVESARDVLTDIRSSAEIDSQLEEALRRHRVPFNSPSWDREESEGLSALLGDASSAVKRITEEATSMRLVATARGRSHG